jgi:catechol 2,3-dioxygenase-like lactoylglutathione lyase family enzyme
MLTDAPIVYVFVYVRNLSVARRFYGQGLGLRQLEEDDAAVKYDAGGIILALNEARAHDIVLSGARDDSALLVFHAADIEAERAELAARGIAVGRTVSYEIGSTAGFLDPDGHSLTLYQPSPQSLGWPSGPKLRSLIDLSDPDADGLGVMPYLFLFVSDSNRAVEFYAERLGLRTVERDPEQGVAKFDTGGLLLATHQVGGDPHSRPVDDHHALDQAALSMVFAVPEVRPVYEALLARGVAFRGGISTSVIGSTAEFRSPDGHAFYLYEPSRASLDWPSGSKVRRLMTRVG